MNPTTVEWVAKSEEDWNMARQLNRQRKDPSYSGVCFHCQQSAEKYLKAYLIENNAPFARTHDLLVLHQLIVQVQPTWQGLQLPLLSLNPFAVAYRYPGLSATQADAKVAIKDCRKVRRALRRALGLPV